MLFINQRVRKELFLVISDARFLLNIYKHIHVQAFSSSLTLALSLSLSLSFLSYSPTHTAPHNPIPSFLLMLS
jgi:hypothetical protein